MDKPEGNNRQAGWLVGWMVGWWMLTIFFTAYIFNWNYLFLAHTHTHTRSSKYRHISKCVVQCGGVYAGGSKRGAFGEGGLARYTEMVCNATIETKNKIYG